jgi:hypothetical protein
LIQKQGKLQFQLHIINFKQVERQSNMMQKQEVLQFRNDPIFLKKMVNLNKQFAQTVFTLLAFLFITNLSSDNVVLGEDSMLTNQKAIEIAENVAVKSGDNVKYYAVTITKHSAPWNIIYPKENNSESVLKEKNKLRDKEYWAVHYYKQAEPGTVHKGGDICIFIDVKTGSVLTTYRGE